jgi:hypothetical protein
MVIINPIIWLGVLGLIYLIGILLYSGLSTIIINREFNFNKTVTFKRTFTDCILGALIGVIISVIVFNLFKVTDHNGSYPPFNVKLLQACCLLPTVTILFMSIVSFTKQRTSDKNI